MMDDEMMELVIKAGTDAKAFSDVMGGVAVIIGKTTNTKEYNSNLEVEEGGYEYKIKYSFTRKKMEAKFERNKSVAISSNTNGMGGIPSGGGSSPLASTKEATIK